MKNSVWLLVLFSAIGAKAHEVRNGGDSMSIAIYRRGDRIMDELLSLTKNCAEAIDLDGVSLVDLNDKWREAKVDTTPNTITLDGQYKEGENVPSLNHILVNRNDYQMSEERDVFVMHEILGLKNIRDPRYVRSRKLVSLIENPNCRGAGWNRLERAVTEDISTQPQTSFIPGATAWDGRNVVYLLQSESRAIFRYSQKEAKYLEPYRLRYNAKTITFSEELGRVYVLSQDGRVTYFNLRDPKGIEMDFAILPQAIDQMVVHGRSLLVASSSGSWKRNYLYDENAKVVDVKDWSYPGNGYSMVRELGAVFYISQFSPRDIQKLSLTPTKIGKETDSPYHGDYDLPLPLITSPEKLVVGSGNVFESESLRWVGRVPSKITNGVWLQKKLITVFQKEPQAFEMIQWNERYFEEVQQTIAGEFVTIQTLDRIQALLVYRDEKGLNFKIITLKGDR